MHRRLFKVRKHLGLTQKQVADILGIGQNAYSMIESGKISLTDRNRTILAEKLYINPLFLLENRGEMLLSTQLNTTVTSLQGAAGAQGASGEHDGRVPFYSKPATDLTYTTLDEMAHADSDYLIDLPPFNDCSFYRPVFGESMSPRYNPGDIVACKRVQNKKMLLYGESYLCVISLDGDQYETIKILRKSPDLGSVILMPCNEAFDSTQVPQEAIAELYIIKGKIERNI
ncbi:MAG: LexA family transcriptional regulator [Mucinivorans sp.]